MARSTVKLPVIRVDFRRRVYYRSKTHKVIYMRWSYGASTIGLAKQYGWRRVNEVIKATFRNKL